MASGVGWQRLMGPDVLLWLLASDEPYTRWLVLTAILDRPADDKDVAQAHDDVLEDAGVRNLSLWLTDWEQPATLSGHESPAFAPTLLDLLARMGVRGGDLPVIDETLAAMLRHTDSEARFESYAVSRISRDGAWSALLCDTHAITDVLVRYVRQNEPAVRASLLRMESDLGETSLGTAWPCVPSLGFRGPGRKGDPCPQVTLEALRTISRLAPELRPARTLDAARTLLGIWRNRSDSKPYMFGHGVGFKTVKWPPSWYSALTVLEAVGGYPELWRGSDARPQERRAIAELAACLIEYNLDSDGRVTPQSCYRGFEEFSFGQKKRPSPFATAIVAAALHRVEDLDEEIAAVDVLALGSSRGGTGRPRPPKGRPQAASAP
jgi:hypothetical protein